MAEKTKFKIKVEQIFRVFSDSGAEHDAGMMENRMYAIYVQRANGRFRETDRKSSNSNTTHEYNTLEEE